MVCLKEHPGATMIGLVLMSEKQEKLAACIEDMDTRLGIREGVHTELTAVLLGMT